MRFPTRTAFAMAAALALAEPACAQTATPSKEEALARKVDELAAELAAVKAQLADLARARASAPAGPQAGEPAAAPAPALAMPAAPATPSEPDTVLGGYAELTYSRPVHANEESQADVARFVLAYQHRFDEKTKAVSELEIEHAVSSADDPGEVEVEQAYVEHQFHPAWAARGGLFLIPMGLLNENHEPDAYYGVTRNFVETAIIPSTWREGGLQLAGNLDGGWSLQAGVSTGFDLSKWDATPESEGQESPLGSIHQELALARARDLSVFGAANWRGIPGLLLGGSFFTGNASQGQTTQHATGRVTLWDLHARWTPDAWDLSALYSRGTISNTARLNSTLLGSAVLIPERFDGWYAQAAYRLWQSGSYALSPFARYEQFNTGRGYAYLGEGVTPAALPTEKVWTVGANFQLAPGVVLKADVQRFDVNTNANRLDLGLGWSF